MATKTAILLLYIRMAAAHPFLRYASYGTLTIVALAGTVLTFLNIFQCRPISAAFGNDDGTCIDVVSLYLASAPINILTDLAILLLPLPILTRLRMEYRQKIALVATFTVGAFVTVVDVVRIAYLQEALREEVLAAERQGQDTGLSSINTRPDNFTYHVSFSLMWSAVEVSVGLMCCCVLVLKPLVMKVIPKLLMSHRHISSTQSREGEATGTKPRETTRRISFIERVTRAGSQSSQSQIVSVMGSAKDNRSPDPNLGAILESPPIPNTLEVDAGDDVEDEGMDFFQMLAADPPTTASSIPKAQPMSPLTTMPLDLPPLSPIPLPDASAITSFPFETPTEPQEVPPRKGRRRATILSLNGRPSRKGSAPDSTQAPTQNFFDFVNMDGRKPLTELTSKEAWGPILFGTSEQQMAINREDNAEAYSFSVYPLFPLGLCIRPARHSQW